MKKVISFLLVSIMCTANLSAATYLINPNATTPGATLTHKGISFSVGSTAFADFQSFLAGDIEANSTVYVANGNYSGDIAIATEGLTFLGNNAFSDWSVSRADESVITGTIYINASNVTINGFKFTEGGRIESTAGTNAAPLSGIKVLYNYFTGMTIKRSTSIPLVEIGNIVANGNANDISSQCRYKDCEASHNHFVGDATHYANCISFGGAFGTTTADDNYFYDGGTGIYFANAQGTLNIKHNVFKSVGKTTFTAPDGGNKGDFCVALYRSGYANSTTANIIANEFDGCYGQASLYPLIRIFQGSSGEADQVKPVNYRINVNDNTFKNKTSITPVANHNQSGQNVILYNDYGTGQDIRFNVSNNHFDNRFYKIAWVTLDDWQGCREIYADQFTRFYLGDTMSDFTSSLTGEDVSYHASAVELDDVTVLQSFDIDPVTGDLYFTQMMPTSRNNAYNSKYGFDSTHDGIVITRIPCTKIDGYKYTYSTKTESMDLGYGGHGMKICTVRDKNGELWLWTGGKASIRDGNDLTSSTARIKFKAGADVNLNTSSDSEDIKYFNVFDAANDYPAVDETSRYLCVRTVTSTTNSYHIYDLDDALEGKKTLIKSVTLNIGDYVRPTINNDNGYNTWAFQSFDIKGDYIYCFEGLPKDEPGNIEAGKPTIVLTLYNWRTNTYVYRAKIDYGRINNLVYGEPEGMVIRPDEYGHACLYLGFVNGNAGSRKVNIFKFIIDYHTDYDATTGTAKIIGKDTSTDAHFKGDYPAISFNCDTENLSFSSASVNESDSKTVTITNGEYILGEWHGVITGEDGDCFNVTMSPNNAFSSTATAKVTFNPQLKRTSYKAYLRLFSPLATSNVESNDIVIPLTAEYTGPTSSVDNNSIIEEPIVKVENKTLIIDNADVKAINVYSTTGALMANSSNSNTLNLSHLNGVYIVNIKSTDNISYTSKVIIK